VYSVKHLAMGFLNPRYHGLARLAARILYRREVAKDRTSCCDVAKLLLGGGRKLHGKQLALPHDE
jgi:hypothetical protein